MFRKIFRQVTFLPRPSNRILSSWEVKKTHHAGESYSSEAFTCRSIVHVKFNIRRFIYFIVHAVAEHNMAGSFNHNNYYPVAKT